MARMDAANTPTAARHCTRVPHASRSVFLIRCSVPDLHLLSDFCDGTLGRDYFFKRRHLQSILERPTNAVFAIEVDRQMAGMVIVYKSTVLDNLYLSPEFRVDGIGTAILDVIRPLRIRSKTNMLAGDPTAFYEKNGYVKDIADPRRPHIIDMVRDTETPIGAQSVRSRAPLSTTAPAGGRAVGVAGSGSVAVASPTAVATPTPPASPAIQTVSAHALPDGRVLIDVDEYNALVSLKKTRDRVRKYRERRREDAARALDPAAAAVTGPVAPRCDQFTADAPALNGEFDFDTFRQ